MITVFLAKALLCVNMVCYPALVGKPDVTHATPVGQSYTLIQRYTQQPGYGGDVVQYLERPSSVLSIHRLWLLSPKQHRLQRLEGDSAVARHITNGCINVDPAVYQLVVASLPTNLDIEP